MALNRKLFKKALVDTVPVMTGYIVLGIGFGIVLKTGGYGLPFALAMSTLVYAGSMQYAAIALIAGGASYLTFAVTTLLVNARHFFYGLSMVEKYRNAKAKPYLIFALTDETYSLVCTRPDSVADEDLDSYYLLVSVMDQCYWVTGSVLGSIFGSFISFNTEGIDFALTALFITIFTDQWLKTKNHYSALAGLLISALCLAVFGADSFLIPAMVLITVALFAGRKLVEP